MRRSDLQFEENYNEYLRLLQNDDYIEVKLDEESGGISAVHKLHKFAKTKGPSGERQGDYERTVLDVLRKRGHRVILGPETNIPGIKSFDGFLNDVPMEIKAIEGIGTWAISTKLQQANRQRAQCVVLYFPEEHLFSAFRVSEGIRLFRSNPNAYKDIRVLSKLFVVVKGDIGIYLDEKATPIEGWSI